MAWRGGVVVGSVIVESWFGSLHERNKRGKEERASGTRLKVFGEAVRRVGCRPHPRSSCAAYLAVPSCFQGLFTSLGRGRRVPAAVGSANETSWRVFFRARRSRCSSRFDGAVIA